MKEVNVQGDLTTEQQFAVRQAECEIDKLVRSNPPAVAIGVLKGWVINLFSYQLRYKNTIGTVLKQDLQEGFKYPKSIPEKLSGWKAEINPREGDVATLAHQMLAATHDAATDANAHLHWTVVMDEWLRLVDERKAAPVEIDVCVFQNEYGWTAHPKDEALGDIFLGQGGQSKEFALESLRHDIKRELEALRPLFWREFVLVERGKGDGTSR